MRKYAGMLRGIFILALVLSAFASETAGAASARQTSPGSGAQKRQEEKTPVFTAGKLAPAGEAELAALRQASEAYKKKDFAAAIAVLTPLAESGSARAAFSLGLMAMRGDGMPMSTEVAERWWLRSAKAGFPDAQYHLGIMHYQGLRGPRNPEFIAQLWNLAAASGQGEAMFGLGFMYRAGDGVRKDPAKSLRMFTDAARLGHPGAAYELGLMYKYGRSGVNKDAAKATSYLEQAAKAGMSQASQELAKK